MNMRSGVVEALPTPGALRSPAPTLAAGDVITITSPWLTRTAKSWAAMQDEDIANGQRAEQDRVDIERRLRDAFFIELGKELERLGFSPDAYKGALRSHLATGFHFHVPEPPPTSSVAAISTATSNAVANAQRDVFDLANHLEGTHGRGGYHVAAVASRGAGGDGDLAKARRLRERAEHDKVVDERATKSEIETILFTLATVTAATRLLTGRETNDGELDASDDTLDAPGRVIESRGLVLAPVAD